MEGADGAEEAHVPALDYHELALAQQLHRLLRTQVDGHSALGVGGGHLPQQGALGGRVLASVGPGLRPLYELGYQAVVVLHWLKPFMIIKTL